MGWPVVSTTEGWKRDYCEVVGCDEMAAHAVTVDLDGREHTVAMCEWCAPMNGTPHR